MAASLIFVVAVGGLSWYWLHRDRSDRRDRHADDQAVGIADLQRQVRSNVANPDSAEFRELRFFRTTGAGCGFVNARTQTGAYTGFLRFVVPKDGYVRFEPTQGAQQISDFLALTAAVCTEKTR